MYLIIFTRLNMTSKTEKLFNPDMSFDTHHKTIRIIAVVLSAIMVITIWKGMTGLLDYYIPNHNLIGNVLCILVPVAIGLVVSNLAGYRLKWTLESFYNHKN